MAPAQRSKTVLSRTISHTDAAADTADEENGRVGYEHAGLYL
ncbi:MAG: hypothetical protein M0Z41_18260 [Peptococcaceae bacterium]|nr:hypothetical protein [Peptococcaceae bacterium]